MTQGGDETAFDPLPAASPAGELPPGTLLNGIYRIEARLGAGGMGEVYRATNLANDEQDAVKVIGRGRADQTQLEAMFRKEARVLARVRAPAVAQLKLFARDPDLGLLYFITDFVAGESLLDRLARQPATPAELRALLRRVLTGLQAVHEAGAVHRDLSPDNIILPDGDVAQAKIIDFGIAKELDPARKTMIGDGFAGKLGYIAPGQLGFSGAEVGPWTDLYSLALVGLAFAAGKPLDMGATVGRADEARRGPIDLSAAPRDLQPVFQRLLTYDWRERPHSAAEVLAMLDGDASAAHVAPPISIAPVVPAVAPSTGSSLARVAVGAIIAILIGLGVALTMRARPAPAPPAPRMATPASDPRSSAPPTASPLPTAVVGSLDAPPCGDPIHVAFGRNASQLISAEPLTLGALRRVQLCRPAAVIVTGKADTDEEEPAALARRRADTVADALRAQGVPAALLKVRTAVAAPDARDLWQNKVAEIGFDHK